MHADLSGSAAHGRTAAAHGLVLLVLLALLVLLTLFATPVLAQDYRAAVGVSGGWSTAGDLTPGLGFETVLGSGWVAGAHYERWAPTGRVGWRLNAAVASRTLEGTERDFAVVVADAGPVLRLLPPAGGRAVAPFVALGAGLVVYRAGGADEPVGDGRYGSDPVVRLVLTPAVGLEFPTRSPVGLRVEAVDQAVFPFVGISPEGHGARVVHNPGLRAVVQLRFGRATGQPAIVASARPDPVGTEPGLEPRPARSPGAPPAAPPPAESPLYTVQIGAFVEPARAREAAARLDWTGLPVWLAEGDLVAPHLVRVRVGAVHSLDVARKLSQRLERELGLEPWIDTVTADEPIPPDAILTTLRFVLSR